jgi:hypothetical protein
MRGSQQYVACDVCGREFKEDTMLPMEKTDLNMNNKEVKIYYESVMSMFGD